MHKINLDENDRIATHFIGGEGINWALDEDMRLAQICAPDFVDQVDLNSASVIYSVWPGALQRLDPKRLVGKIVVCEFDNPPFHWIKQPPFLRIRESVSLWVSHTSQAAEQASILGLPALSVPYRLDGNFFYPRQKNSAEVIELRRYYSIPENCYVIGNFHRDSEGVDLQFPKLQKAPDVFLQIVLDLLKKKYPIHILLAGPRRHWLRRQLQAHKIPFTFIGKMIEGDDIVQNVLPRTELNNLYACLDLVLITSRWEGGPYSVLEGAATKSKILCSRVGLSEDVLEPESIFDHPDQAVEIIEKDIRLNFLEHTIIKQYDRYLHGFTLAPAKEAMSSVFHKIRHLSKPIINPQLERPLKIRAPSCFQKITLRLGFKKNIYSQKTVSILREFHKPPYGGGNQFMLALRSEFEKMNVRVLNNEVNSRVDAYLFDSLWFDMKLLDKLSKLNNPRVGHRIDGPIHLYRNKDRNLDDQIFEINKQFATVSIIQSIYTLRAIYKSGYLPISPIVIPNAVNPDIFFPREKHVFSREKIKLVSTSWSDNPMKGAIDYKWLDENLDFNRYSYTFYGRIKENFKNIIVEKPLPSSSLGEALRKNDIYITASQNDPCSNALIEAMASGLPILYKNSGGHPELVGFGGLPYNECVEIPFLLERIIKNYYLFNGCLTISPSAKIAERYLDALFLD